MTDTSEWQGRAGESWAAEYRRTDRSFTQLTERLLSEVRPLAFANVLDIGCGAGELALAIARSHPAAQVTGVDISPDLIATARDRSANLANLVFERADAANHEASLPPDLLISRHGVMFFDDPTHAFTHLASEAHPHAALLFSCFRARDENPLFTEVGRLLPEPPEDSDPRAPGPFAFAERGYVSGMLAQSGWGDVRLEPFDFPMIVGTGENAVEDAVCYFTRIGPAAKAAAQMDAAAHARFRDRALNLAERYCYDGIVALPAAAWIVSARKI
ncbi:class I SAM-dependent methyltransferase [Aurantiacibacter aquimixticola]|uniref:Methyltransferase domain-containing protein n=1 Tax=Aurantiacibacter aquimixticola TaxID=1958945 RepID=A0A419RSZ2_9SPHN|nr:class I SAM-dependent methyltransferase [Aurantiacibacter aquimixticola]RJY08864.1 methyltransferase domain-containing protein [Aurantiacibacter aquimixticola]